MKPWVYLLGYGPGKKLLPPLAIQFPQGSRAYNVVVPLVGQYGLWVSFFFAHGNQPSPNAFEFYYLIKIFKNISEEVNTILISYGILDIFF